MCKRLCLLIFVVLLAGSISSAEDIQWTDLGPDHLWSTPDNWDLGRVPTLDDEVRIDVPAAAAPNGPVIQDGIDAKAKGIFTEAPGEPTLTMTGGTLEVADWIWWGDGTDSFATWTMSGGSVTVTNEFELGWGGGAGILIMTGGTITAGKFKVPTGSGAFAEAYLDGGTFNVTKPGGLDFGNANGRMDITGGTLVLEGDDTAKVNDLIAAGQITAYGSDGLLELDYDARNPGKTTLTAVERVLLFAEDFEGLELGPNVDEALAGDAVWTDTPPAGWTVDESGIPGIGMDETDGVTEWAGWAFTDKAWWTETAGDQRRSEFVLGSGTVAVADPDEWDDAERLPIPISADPYDTWLSTPAIDISGVEAGSLRLKFDSSWRPEFDDNYHQTASITASFDGGDPVEVLLWESDSGSPNYKPNATNETVHVDLDNPVGAKRVVLTFGLFDAGNDWWWAIDNVEVGGVFPELVPINPGTAGLGAYYAFDNDTNDGSGNDNHGTIVGTGTEWVAGRINGALLFKDGAGYVEVPDSPSLNPTDEITIAAWINPTWTGNNRVLQKGSSDNQYRLLREWGDNFVFHLSGVGRLEGIATPPDNEWHHVAATYNGAAMKIYYDGKVAAEQAASGPIGTSSDSLFIGTKHATAPAGDYFYGILDEVYFYSRALLVGEVLYLAGERAPYTYNGDAAVAGGADNYDSLDGTWDHNNGSDQWDGSGIGEGRPGGASALVEDGVTFLRIQDTGDPRDYGMGDPGSNRKVYLTHLTDIGLDGARLEVGIRVATSAPLDDAHPNGGAGIEPWPEGGIGYHIRDHGKGMFGISDGVGIISFSLAKAGEPDFADVATDVLVMNNLVGTEPSADVDTGDAAVAANMLAIDDATQWNTFVIDIAAGGAGTHIVTVSANGGPAEAFEVTTGDGTEEDVPYITVGSSGTGGITAFDVDYISVSLPPAVDPSLVIYYSFDEVGDVVADQSGKGHDGVVVGDVTASADGVRGGCAKLGAGGYLDLDGPNFPAEDIPTSALTLAAWTNVDGTSGKNAIFNAKATDPDSGHVWLIHPEIRTGGDNDYRFTLRGAGSTKIGDIDHGKTGYPPSPGIGNPRPNEWVHVAMTYSKEDARMTLYVDGQIVLRRGGDGAGDPINNAIDIAGNWDLGARVGYNIDDARHYTGLMDEFYMFTRELSQDEILALMDGL